MVAENLMVGRVGTLSMVVMLTKLSSLIPSVTRGTRGPRHLHTEITTPAVGGNHPASVCVLSTGKPAIRFIRDERSRRILRRVTDTFGALCVFRASSFISTGITVRGQGCRRTHGGFRTLIGGCTSALSVGSDLSTQTTICRLRYTVHVVS